MSLAASWEATSRMMIIDEVLRITAKAVLRANSRTRNACERSVLASRNATAAMM
jgi:hypothetical protein